jgi:hypothetical protein
MKYCRRYVYNISTRSALRFVDMEVGSQFNDGLRFSHFYFPFQLLLLSVNLPLLPIEGQTWPHVMKN